MRSHNAKLTLLDDLPEFALRHPIPVEDDPPQIERLLLLPGAVVLVEIEDALRHLLEVLDHLQAPGLHATLGDILRRIGVHAADECGEGRTALRAGRGMDDVGAEQCELAHHPAHVARCTYPMTMVGLCGSVRAGTERASGTALIPPILTLILSGHKDQQ